MTAQPEPPPPLRPVSTAPRFGTARAIGALVLREMSTTYGRSPGGYLWALLEPALGIMLLVFIFSTGFRSPPLGSNFAIFYASGVLPFLTFLTIQNKCAQAINFSKQLLGYPRVTFIDAIFARFILSLATQILVSVIIFSLILYIFDTRTILILPRLLQSYAMAASLGLGFGLITAVLTTRFPLWQSIWSVLTRPLVLVSGVIFLPEWVPDPYRSWLEWNPLVHVVGESRRAFYYSYEGEYVEPAFAYALALIGAVTGILFLRSYYRDFLER